MLRSDESNIAFAHAILNVKYQQSLGDNLIQRIMQCRSAEEPGRSNKPMAMPPPYVINQSSPQPKKAATICNEKQVVDHSYTDFSQTSDDTLYELMRKDVRLAEEQAGDGSPSSTGRSKSSRSRVNAMGWKMLEDRPGMNVKEKLNVLYSNFRRNSGGVVQPFPEKLMELLANSKTQHIVSWMPHGRAFKVHNQKQFIEEVLPTFAGSKNIKYMSFNRQLNLWGFKRLTKGLDNGAYYHELFLRGRPMLAMRMKRHKVKGTGVKLGSNPEMEPNFYTLDLPRLPELSELDETGAVPFTEDSAVDADQLEEAQDDESQNSDDSTDAVHEQSEYKSSEERVEEKEEGQHYSTKRLRDVEDLSQKLPAKKAQADPYPSPSLLSDNEIEKRAILGAAMISSHSIPGLRVNEHNVSELPAHYQSRVLSEEVAAFRPHSEDHQSREVNGSRPSEMHRELAQNEMLLEKQRQELSLLTALANLKRQEYDIMCKMCQLGENALSRGLVYRASLTDGSDNGRGSTVEAAILHDQLASVRAMQRNEVGRIAPELLQRCNYGSDTATHSGFDGRMGSVSHFSSAVSNIMQPPEASQRNLLGNRQEQRRAAETPASPALVHAARRLSKMRRGNDEEVSDSGHLAFPLHK